MKIIALKIYGDVLPYIMEGCVEGFRELGHRVRIVDLSESEGSVEILDREVDDFLPDFLFTINHLGLTGPVRGLLSKLRLSYASWWVDNPLLLTTSESFKSPYLTLFIWDRFYIERLRVQGFNHIHHLPLAASSKIFRDIELTPEEKERFGCGLSFVGGAFYNGFLAYQEYQKGGDPGLKDIIDQTLRLYFNNPSLELRDIIQEVKEGFQHDLSVKEEGELVVSLELMSMSLYRKEIIEGVEGLGLHLYGDEGWRKLIPSPFPLPRGERIKVRGKRAGAEPSDGIRFLGRIDYRNELPKLYNASQINLNITKSQLKTAINQRVYDVSACGGFVLSDFRHDLGRLFEIDKEVVFYRDKEDLKEKIKYFLAHPEERRKISKRAQERVSMEHTYTHRMENLVETVRSEKE